MEYASILGLLFSPIQLIRLLFEAFVITFSRLIRDIVICEQIVYYDKYPLMFYGVKQ